MLDSKGVSAVQTTDRTRVLKRSVEVHAQAVSLLQVPCLADGDARLALDPKDAFAVQTKPHGHGDVHALLHSSGLAAAWQQQGVQWLCFFQDTNGLVFRALPAALGGFL